MKYMEKHFNNLKKGRGSKKMIAGLIIRAILVLAVFAGGKFVCDNFEKDAEIYYNERR